MSEPLNREGLQALYTYNHYANSLVLDVADKLTEEELARPVSPSHDSAHGLLTHMLGVETFFLATCREVAPDFESVDWSTPAKIRAAWEQLAEEQQAFLATVSAADLARVLTLPFRQSGLHLPMWQLLTQAMLHSVHHRGELSIVLTRLGYPLPTLDAILHWVKESGQVWPLA